ncbi:hypothetical protein [Campylobacter concisus]|nr:hypothetical protein [Campylobacter concisus]
MINGLNANLNYDFSSAHGQNLKTQEEKEADIMGLLRKISKMCLNLKA